MATPLTNGASHGPVICLVDDDESIRVAIAALLRSVGFETQSFGSGEEFLVSGLAGSADCLIVDLRMKGMSGLELQATLRNAGSTLPIIFISAHGDDDVRSRAVAAGALGFLSKPFDDTAFLNLVRAALRSRP